MSTAELIQGSVAWKNARVGYCTASRIADVIAKTKTGWGASRANYMAQLVAERLTGEPQEGYTNAAMQWGTATELEARMAYEFMRDCEVREVGFIPHATIPLTGASPDGLVGEDGLVEIKAPQTATHIETLLSGKVPDKYRVQMQWQMACAGRQWCDFASFDPRMPGSMRLWVKRVERDDAQITELEKQVEVFLAEVAEKVEQLTALYGGTLTDSLRARLASAAA